MSCSKIGGNYFKLSIFFNDDFEVWKSNEDAKNFSLNWQAVSKFV